jgi:GT2 family glycosyltransferase
MSAAAEPADVSVIMPTWNRPQYLRASIDSVLAQDIAIRELIIADDGSDAATRAVLECHATRPGVRVLWRDHSGRPAAVRNAAIREAAGKYVAFADSDDLWHPGKLRQQLAALAARPDCRWSFTAWSSIDADQRELPAIPVPDYRHIGTLLERLATLSISVALPSVLVERALLSEAGPFEESFGSYEDYDLWVRLAALAGAAIVTQPLVQVRWHGERFSRGSPLARLRSRANYFERAGRRVQGPARARLRRLQALDSARVASLAARAGDADALAVLRDSFPGGWSSPRWWLLAAQAHSRLWTLRARRAPEGP